MPSALSKEDQQRLVERLEQERIRDLAGGIHHPHGAMDEMFHVWCPTCKTRGADRKTKEELRADIDTHTAAAANGKFAW